MIYPIRLIAPLLVLTLAVAGTVAAQADSGDTKPRRSRNALTQAEMLETTATTIMEAVRQLKPMWLVPRGTAPSGQQQIRPVIYIDGVRAGELELLDQIRIEEVERLRYLSGRDATTRWGTGVAGGVIEVFRIRG